MSLVFQQQHLRLEVPQTTDGMNLKYDGEGRVKTKVVLLPMSSRLRIESNNAKKPTHLRAKITVVEGDKIAAKRKAEKVKATKEKS